MFAFVSVFEFVNTFSFVFGRGGYMGICVRSRWSLLPGELLSCTNTQNPPLVSIENLDIFDQSLVLVNHLLRSISIQTASACHHYNAIIVSLYQLITRNIKGLTKINDN